MFRYNQGADIIELVIRDSTGAKIDTYKFNSNDKELSKKINGIISWKYGFNVSSKPSSEEKDKDLSWLKKTDW